MYTRRSFLKAAGSGAVTMTAGATTGCLGGGAAAPQTTPQSPPASLAIPAPVTQERATFRVNGKSYDAEYEARTTLWEVLAVKLGLTGTNRSCNRATCGACGVLVDGVPQYSCHLLATEAAGREVSTIEGLGTETSLHPLQQLAHKYVAADCGFCTPGWMATAKALLDRNPNCTAADAKAALAGHICRCSAYAAIVRTVVDAGKVLRGEVAIDTLEAVPHDSVVITQPMVRTFSTGGGHGPEDVLVEGDEKIVTKKWQGYPPVNLNIVGKPRPPLPEVAVPRLIGTAEYATRVRFADMLHAKVLTSPHPRARVRRIDTSKALQIPGVAYILTHENSPKTSPIPRELNFQGQVVAIAAAVTEDIAEDALAIVDVEYEVLPFATTLQQVMAPNAPDLSGRGRGNLAQLNPKHPAYNPAATFTVFHGDVDKAFAAADVVREFTYRYSGGVILPMQPSSCAARWDGDRLTFWGMCQGVYPERDALARELGISAEQIRFIDRWNGGTFGAAQRNQVFYPWIAHLAKVTNRPVRMVLPKDQELAHLQVKPENIVKFKVGAMRDGKIVACERWFWQAFGDGSSASTSGGGRSELYLHVVPNWRETGYNYTTNSPRQGASRSNMQQEFKWSWEQMMDEMAEAVGMDPVNFRLLNVQHPGTTLTHEQGGPTVTPMPESLKGTLTYDSYAVEEVCAEGQKEIGWQRRNPQPGAGAGRFRRGLGMALSQHHAGRVGYREGEPAFEKRVAEMKDDPDGGGGGGGETGVFQSDIELDGNGRITLRGAMPDSGTNHDTAMTMLVAEILGYTTLDNFRTFWGDSDTGPRTVKWNSGLTTQLQGGAHCSAADKLRTNLLQRASKALQVPVDDLQIRDGVISSKSRSSTRTTFAALARANGGMITERGRAVHPGSIGRAMNRGIGSCFVEVEVDTWTGNWRFVRAAYCHDSGFIINPLLGEADMCGSLTQATQVATEAIPWDREFPGTLHYSVGFLSYRLPTIGDIPEQKNVFINSLEPRWFFGCKGFAETAIGAPPGALANAIYNACGVRIREHPITREKIMAGLKAIAART